MYCRITIFYHNRIIMIYFPDVQNYVVVVGAENMVI